MAQHSPADTADVTQKAGRYRAETIVEVEAPLRADGTISQDSGSRRLERDSRIDAPARPSAPRDSRGQDQTPRASRGRLVLDGSPDGQEGDALRSPGGGLDLQAKGMPKDSLISEQNLYRQIGLPEFLLSYDQYLTTLEPPMRNFHWIETTNQLQ
jgi:hypothetical protein